MRANPFSFLLFIIITAMAAGSAFPAPAFADDDFIPTYHPNMHVRRAAGKISIDGKLDDPGWRGAAEGGNFSEHQPGDQIRPPVDTRVFLTYDDARLYAAFICYDDPADIRASFCERDRMYSDDNVGLFIDTYGDAAWAYTLNVNPYGIQADALWSSGYGEDSKYDLIWESAARITDSGYQVEMAIPFSSLRFPNKEKQIWRVDFYRHHYRASHYQISWSAYDRDEPCWPCMWGTVTGIENVTPGRGIEILPAVIGYQAGYIVGDGETSPFGFHNEDIDGDACVTGKYSISSNITVEATVNPDFSQVEADADQIDVNSTTALTFPEKRPFFQEGSDMFRTPFDLVYTRSINDPDFAAKFTARMGRTSITYLGAHDEHSPVVIPFEEFSTPVLMAGKSVSNIMRARRTFGDNSQVGIMVTDRHFTGGGSGSVGDIDGFFRLSKNINLRVQAAASYTHEPDDTLITSGYNDYVFDGEHTSGYDGESFWGHAYIGLLDYEGRNIYLSGRYSEISPTFRTDNGIMTQNDRRQASVVADYVVHFDGSLLDYLNPQIFAGEYWDTDGRSKMETVQFNLAMQLKLAQANMHGQYFRTGEDYAGYSFDDVWGWHLCMQMTPGYLASFGGSINYGHRIARRAVDMGKETTLSGWLDLKPIDRLLIENWFDFSQSRRESNDEMLFKGYIARSRLNFQVNRELSLRFVVQYNDFWETWDFDPLVTLKLNPFTLFYIGSTYDYERIYGLNDAGDMWADSDEPAFDKTRLASRQFFMKLQYLFQL